MLISNRLFALTLLTSLSYPVVSQFTCTFSGAKDASSCTSVTDDSNSHCVWCALGGGGGSFTTMLKDFGFCVSESQAEAMEQGIPNIHCDRYSDTDDSYTTDDDNAPADDDQAPDSDDDSTTDDQLPDNYWKCLELGKEKDCDAQGCTWCETKGGFGLCMTGPTADSASDSDWFKCKKNSTTESWMTTKVLENPYDPACLIAYLHDQSKDACEDTLDSDGNNCEYCNLQGAVSMCLTAEQAEMSEQMGVVCDKEEDHLDDPYDPSCLMAFLQDNSPEACKAAVDSDGNACEFCTLQGALSMCLNEEQAAMGEQFGITCNEEEEEDVAVDDPYDPSCLRAYLQDSSKEHCIASVDAFGNACEFCTMQGALDMCLNADQAAMGEAIGISCDDDEKDMDFLTDEDPYDPSCAMAYLQNPTEEGCHAAVDSDGSACLYCTLQGALNLCLNADQAAMGEQLGITCDSESSEEVEEEAAVALQDPFDPSCVQAFLENQSEEDCVAAVDQNGNNCEYCSLPGSFAMCLNEEQASIGQQLGMECQTSPSKVDDPYDASCALAYLQDPSKDGCLASKDSEGLPCEYCSIQGAFNLCLNSEQAAMGEQMGVTCDEFEDDETIMLPPDFFSCLEHYKDDDCRSSSCTWCNTEVGMGFCLSTAAAESTKQCTFFDCELENVKEGTSDIYDPLCLEAGIDAVGDKNTACAEAQGMNGEACVWCDAAGVFGVCVSSDQANAVGQYLQCNPAIASE